MNNILGSQDIPPPPPMPASIPMDLETGNSGGAGDVLITAPSSPFRNNPLSLFNNAASAFNEFGAGKTFVLSSYKGKLFNKGNHIW